MSIVDRVILTLYTFLMAIAAVLIIIVSRNVIPLGEFVDFAARIPGKWEYTIGGIVLLSMSIRLLVAGINGNAGNALTIPTENSGKILVGQGAMEDYIEGFTNDVYGVYGARVKVKMDSHQQLFVRIYASIEPDINIPDTTEEVKRVVARNVRKVIGIEVADVTLHFKHIKAKE